MPSNKSDKKEKTVIAYIPVIHQGYLSFLDKHKPEVLYVMSLDAIGDIDHISRKDIRRVEPSKIVDALRAMNITPRVELFEKDTDIVEGTTIAMPDEEISRHVADNYLQNKEVEFDKVFLRWHRDNTTEKFEPKADIEISKEEFDKEMMDLSVKLGEKSLDWYRQVGGVLVKDGEVVLTAYNSHQPTPYNPYEVGDPRSNFKRGLNIEFATSFHVESALISEAAKKGIALEGASMYVSTYPCPPCAKAIAHSGIKKLYFREGYSVAALDGEEILKTAGVQTIYVK